MRRSVGDYRTSCAGDLLRDAVKKGNSALEAIMKEGKLVPLETAQRSTV
jgi:hypothetical protein